MTAEEFTPYCVCADDWAKTSSCHSGVFETLEEAFQCEYPVTRLILRRGVHKWPQGFSLPPNTTLSLFGLPNDVLDTVLDIGEGITLSEGQKLILEDLTLRQRVDK